MWIVRLALRRPFTVAALCLVILLMGVLSTFGMDVDIFPSIDIPVVVVVWNYPGLSAQDMERRVTLISERAFSTTVSGISRLDSQSITGLSVIRVYFEPGSDIGGAIAQISATALTASRVMPPGIQPPTLLRFNASNVPVVQLTVAGSAGEQELFDYGLNFLRVRLFTIPGLATPAPYGGKQRQVMVDVDPARVAAKGLSPQDVVQALLAQNVLIPAGSARMGNTDYDVLLNGSPDTVTAFNELPVKAVNGATVFLGDVASAHDGFAVQTNLVRVDGKRATYLAIIKKENASTLAVVDATRELLPTLRATAPNGVVLKLDFDQSVFVRGAVNGVLREGVIAATLVSLMTLVFIGSWRSTLIVCISIPLSLLCGVIGLKLCGQSLNLMTLGGLALAIGMLVDDATVEVENINRNRSQGKALTKAILDGARQIATPALAATVTICIVFFPVVLLTGPAKFLFTPLALAVVFSMLASYLLSRTLVPSLAYLLLAKEKPEGLEGHLEDQHEASGAEREHWREPPAWAKRLDERRVRAFERLRSVYASILSTALAARAAVLACAALFVVTSLFLVLVVGLDFFPTVDAGILRMHFRASPGTRIEQTERLVDAAEQRIRAIVPAAELETVNDNLGVPVSYNLGFVPTDNVDGADAEILVSLKKKHRPSRDYAQKIRRVLAEEFPSATIYFQQADIVGQVLNFGLSAPIDVQVQGQDTKITLPLAVRLEQEIAAIPGAEDVRLAQVLNHPGLLIDVDRPRAAQLGLTERDVANSLLTSLSSSSLVNPNFWLNPKNNVNYLVAVQTPIYSVTSVAELMGTPITPGNAPVGPTPSSVSSAFTPPPPSPSPPLTPLTTYVGGMSVIRETQTRTAIHHYTVQPVLDVQLNVEDRDLQSVASDIDKAVERLGKLPPGVEVHVRGQSETMRHSFGLLGLGLLVAIALVYLLLIVLFQSWLDPLIIMIAIPGAFSGILWMLTITGTTLNVESFMGAIMAVGIATSNSILLVNFANDMRIANPAVDAAHAALEAGSTRLRPVIMTALAMVLGMLPMALGLGEGGEQNAPLGRAVIGGLLVATMVTLFIVPCAYAIMRRAQPQKGHRDREITEAETGART